MSEIAEHTAEKTVASAKQAAKKVATWWHKSRVASREEKLADAIVHGVGLVIAIVGGAALLGFAAVKAAPETVAPLSLYVGALVVLLIISMLFNMWPRTAAKRLLARLDQAAIFMFIAATYTPFLSLIWDSPRGFALTLIVWTVALIGVAAKLIAPMHFGRTAILLHLALGWGGILIFQQLDNALPPAAWVFLISGGVVYSAGLIFHCWEELKFHNAIWHGFVVVGAFMHLIAMFDTMIIARA